MVDKDEELNIVHMDDDPNDKKKYHRKRRIAKKACLHFIIGILVFLVFLIILIFVAYFVLHKKGWV